MTRSQESLSLRRQTIRTLTVTELSTAVGGGAGAKTGTCIPTRTTNRTK